MAEITQISQIEGIEVYQIRKDKFIASITIIMILTIMLYFSMILYVDEDYYRWIDLAVIAALIFEVILLGVIDSRLRLKIRSIQSKNEILKNEEQRKFAGYSSYKR